MLLLRLLFLFVVTARNMNGFSRIGSFLFGQEDPELSADVPTRMVCSDSDDDGHSLASGSERIHVDGDFNISVSPRDVVDPPGSPVSPLKGGLNIRATPVGPREFQDTPRPQGGLFPDDSPAHRFRLQRPDDEAISSDSMTVNTSGGSLPSLTPGKYGAAYETSRCDDSLGEAAAHASTDVDVGTPPSGRQSATPPPTPRGKRKVDWASTPNNEQVQTSMVDYSPSPVPPLRPILKRQQHIYGKPGHTPYTGTHWKDDSVDSGYHNTPSSLSSTGSSNYSSFVNDFSLSPGGGEMHPVSRCTVKPKKFDGKNWAGYKLHFLWVAQANCWNQNEAARVLKSSLDDDVAMMLRRRLRRGDATLEDIFAALDARFNVPGPDYVLRSKVRRTTQKPNQTVAQFQRELMRVLACRVDAEESPEALEQFVYGMIDPKMQKYVAKRQPEDIHEALLYAREYEETTAWMGSATRSITKRIAMVSLDKEETGAPPKQPESNEQSAAVPTDAQLLAELARKVAALELRNQEAAERSRLWKERRQQGFQKKWNRDGKNDQRNQPSNNGDANRPAVRQVKMTEGEDSAAAADADESGES